MALPSGATFAGTSCREGGMTVTVQSDECGQLGAVLRVPAVATRVGEVPPDVPVPDPATLPENPAPPTGPHR
jgi:serine/threonine-protein kinase